MGSVVVVVGAVGVVVGAVVVVVVGAAVDVLQARGFTLPHLPSDGSK